MLYLCVVIIYRSRYFLPAFLMRKLFVESAKSRGLRGNMGQVGASVAWMRGYVGQNIFYVGHNFYMGSVGQNVLRGSLCGSKIFAWVNILGGSPKKISIGALTIISQQLIKSTQQMLNQHPHQHHFNDLSTQTFLDFLKLIFSTDKLISVLKC